MFKFELKRLRMKLRATQQRMATDLKIPYSTYKSWEQGKCLPTFVNLERVIKFAKTNHANFRELAEEYEKEKSKR